MRSFSCLSIKFYKIYLKDQYLEYIFPLANYSTHNTHPPLYCQCFIISKSLFSACCVFTSDGVTVSLLIIVPTYSCDMKVCVNVIVNRHILFFILWVCCGLASCISEALITHVFGFFVTESFMFVVDLGVQVGPTHETADHYCGLR